jgi:hypothetical protein
MRKLMIALLVLATVPAAFGQKKPEVIVGSGYRMTITDKWNILSDPSHGSAEVELAGITVEAALASAKKTLILSGWTMEETAADFLRAVKKKGSVALAMEETTTKNPSPIAGTWSVMVEGMEGGTKVTLVGTDNSGSKGELKAFAEAIVAGGKRAKI